MKKLICLFTFFFVGSVNAEVIHGFTGGYHPSNWTQSVDDGHGLVRPPDYDPVYNPGHVSMSHGSISLRSSDWFHWWWGFGWQGPDDPSDDIHDSSQSMDATTTALGDGLVKFDWEYETGDFRGSSGDPFGYLLNGVFTQLTIDDPCWIDDPCHEWSLDPRGSEIPYPIQSDTTSFAVNKGDVFGFRQHSIDSIEGPAETDIWNFSAPAPVPAPASILLLAVGLVSIRFVRKSKRT